MIFISIEKDIIAYLDLYIFCDTITKYLNNIKTNVKYMVSRDNTLPRKYIKLFGLDCSNPNCKSGLDPEVHHIIPISLEGEDTLDNLIVLCRNCHRNRGLHKDFKENLIELYVWKYFKENPLNQTQTQIKEPIIEGEAKEEINYIPLSHIIQDDIILEDKYYIPYKPKPKRSSLHGGIWK